MICQNNSTSLPSTFNCAESNRPWLCTDYDPNWKSKSHALRILFHSCLLRAKCNKRKCFIRYIALYCVFRLLCQEAYMIVKLISKRIVMVVNCSVNKGMPRLFEFIVRRLLFVFKPVWMKILSILRRTMYQLVTFMAFFSIFQKINRYW